jgi:hypothetical protein
MKDSLKYGSYIVIALTIAYICATLRDCGTVGEASDRVDIPADSGYLPIVRREYSPNPLPFGNSLKPVSKLPKGVKESDINRVITIRSSVDTLVIIQTKSGEVFVPRKTDSIEVTVTDYQPPVLRFGLFAGIGLSLNSELKVSPSVSISPVIISERWYAPIITADLRSVGIGIGYRFYHDLTITPLLMWNYLDTQRTIKINVSYQL